MIELSQIDWVGLTGWLGTIAFFYGVYLLGQKRVGGFYANVIGNFMYVIQPLLNDNPPLLCLSIGLIVLNIVGIVNWSNSKDSGNNKRVSKKELRKHRKFHKQWEKHLERLYDL